MQNISFQKFKPLFIVLGSLMLLLIIVLVVLNLTPTSTISLFIAPSDATILIDGKRYKNGTYEITPGDHTVSISRDDFTPKEYPFTTTEGQTTELRDYLEPLYDKDWYSKNEADGMILGSILEGKALKDSLTLYEKYPIISILPINVEYFSNNYADYIKYSISYQTSEDNKSITIIITDHTGGNLQTAIDNLKTRGYDIAQYEYKYIDKSSSESLDGHAF